MELRSFTGPASLFGTAAALLLSSCIFQQSSKQPSAESAVPEAARSEAATPVLTEEPTVWFTVGRDRPGRIEVHGLPWFGEGPGYGRLPARAKAKLRKMNPGAWDESLCPSGARVRFKTDSSTLRIRVLHGHERISMIHMPATGAAGIDLYEGPPGAQVYRGTSRPRSGMEAYEHVFLEGADRKLRDLTLYLPTYARLEKLEIGVDRDSAIERAEPYRLERPIVFYGTSITQSCCASRGSNGYVPLLGRMLGADVVNLGFSGAGKGEPMMAALISEIDAAAYVIDSVANMDEKVGGRSLMRRNYRRFVEGLRERRPDTPIILMTRIRFADTHTPWGEMLLDTDEKYKELHAPLFETYEALKKKGDKRIYLFDAAEAVPRQGEHPSVDGIHLNDRGFWILAEKLRPLLESLESD